ncbi:unknown [Prevotella sp. CAG:279]|nr:unknown [Prevotella sp. CAG:279]
MFLTFTFIFSVILPSASASAVAPDINLTKDTFNFLRNSMTALAAANSSILTSSPQMPIRVSAATPGISTLVHSVSLNSGTVTSYFEPLVYFFVDAL